MDFKQIQELIQLVNDTNIGEVSIEQKDFKITIRQKEEQITQVMAASMPQMQLPMPQMQAPQVALPAASGAAAPAGAPAAASANTVTIKSPMIGTFYRRPSPDKPDFVTVGDEVSPGKVVCIIEAMKLFNEIESEVKGKIVKILVEDASPVEYDQPLFLVEPA
ncbi:acetyl-CoA carboxylase biotin carboxyl carrier protein [Flaviaesturariibacter flavus]|uniref:Biotin carboxyl carrier protein of acetyl-CoA carboxylase n=1 Tax=Flaviaesturariibacter flavus TaxID=2502780 RepID=A0A4R1B8N7_9BACT|nr:acetyl-CoA carboxylase biotin carboxyl carrier protein [Flaviaesturariibacter flavus]TCJ12603.1 acetyl-CoA carboxylase biotin carboxyl carrier protein [Flaviaesturariibacter flavus]